MHYPPISNLIRLCTKVQLNYPSVRYGPTCSHVYTTKSSSIHINGDRPYSEYRPYPSTIALWTHLKYHLTSNLLQMIHILQTELYPCPRTLKLDTIHTCLPYQYQTTYHAYFGSRHICISVLPKLILHRSNLLKIHTHYININPIWPHQ